MKSVRHIATVSAYPHWFERGTIYYVNDRDQLHREKDLPASINPVKGTRCWAYDGEVHRVCGPATELIFVTWTLKDVDYFVG